MTDGDQRYEQERKNDLEMIKKTRKEKLVYFAVLFRKYKDPIYYTKEGLKYHWGIWFNSPFQESDYQKFLNAKGNENVWDGSGIWDFKIHWDSILWGDFLTREIYIDKNNNAYLISEEGVIFCDKELQWNKYGPTVDEDCGYYSGSKFDRVLACSYGDEIIISLERRKYFGDDRDFEGHYPDLVDARLIEYFEDDLKETSLKKLKKQLTEGTPSFNFDLEKNLTLISKRKQTKNQKWPQYVKEFKEHHFDDIKIKDLAIKYDISSRTIKKHIAIIRGALNKLLGDKFELYCKKRYELLQNVQKVVHSGKIGQSDLIIYYKNGLIRVENNKIISVKQNTIIIHISDFKPELIKARELFMEGKAVQLHLNIFNPVTNKFYGKLIPIVDTDPEITITKDDRYIIPYITPLFYTKGQVEPKDSQSFNQAKQWWEDPEEYDNRKWEKRKEIVDLGASRIEYFKGEVYPRK